METVLSLAISLCIVGCIHSFGLSRVAVVSQAKTRFRTFAKSYTSESITVLKDLEPVRKRPGMYIGSTGTKGLHHLVFEVVDNSIDEALAGFCKNIDVTLQNDGFVEVKDNGRGIPCEMHPTTGKSTLETVLCVLHAGGKFGGESSGYEVSGGLHGVGISVVNALSDQLSVKVSRDNSLYSMNFSKGIPTTELMITPQKPHLPTGTTVSFKPDPTIFKETTTFEFDRIGTRLDELAYLNPGLTIQLHDARVDSNNNIVNSVINNDIGRHEKYFHAGGIKELITIKCQNYTKILDNLDVITIREKDTKKKVTVDVALQWSKDKYDDDIVGFVNGIKTHDGGTHIDGFKAAISKVVNQYAKKMHKIKDNTIPGDFVREGLTAVISVKVPEPEFEGQTKTRLGNPEIRQIVDTIVSESLQNLFDFNTPLITAIISKALDAQTASIAAKAARDVVRKKSLLQSTILPGKLADCSSRDPSESEIYLVEGDSAAGSAKLGRDRKTQAILPLKGKILNIEKATDDKIYNNAEIQSLIAALGLGPRNQPFHAENLRYHRIVIMTDADVDGAHIRLLLLTFLYRYHPELITQGYVYIACPPLYKLIPQTSSGGGGSKKENKELYFYDQDELDTYLKQQQQQQQPQSVSSQATTGGNSNSITTISSIHYSVSKV